jgi:hypothetical protein
MRLGNQVFAPAGPANAGGQMYAALMGAATPVPARYMHVDVPSVPLQATVPLTEGANFHAATGFANPVPNQERTFLAARKAFQDRVDREAICVHQRGYAITDSSSQLPLLSTLSIAPCIVVVVHNPNTRTAALTHVDANMNTTSIANVVNEFAPGAPLDLFFHGGLANNPDSRATCEGLLQALFQLEAGQQRFTVREFDVVGRPHGREVTFDTATATVHPSFAPSTIRLDSVFRTLQDGTYLVGDAVMMANRCEQMATSTDPAVSAAGIAARDIRKQFDGRPDKITNFLKTVEAAVFSAVGATAVQRAGRGSPEAVAKAASAALRNENALESVESNLKTYLGMGGSKAGDTSYLVEALIIALINEDDPTEATRAWLVRTRR